MKDFDVDPRRFPTIAAVLKESSASESVLAWSVNDVAKLFKGVEKTLQKIEVGMAAEENDSWRRGQVASQLVETQKLLRVVADRLNRVLNVT